MDGWMDGGIRLMHKWNWGDRWIGFLPVEGKSRRRRTWNGSGLGFGEGGWLPRFLGGHLSIYFRLMMPRDGRRARWTRDVVERRLLVS